MLCSQRHHAYDMDSCMHISSNNNYHLNNACMLHLFCQAYNIINYAHVANLHEDVTYYVTNMYSLVIHMHTWLATEITSLPVDVGIISDPLVFNIEDTARLDDVITANVKK